MRRISDGCSHSNGFTPTAKPSTCQNPEAPIRVAQMRSADDGAAAPTIAAADRGSPHSCPEKCRNGPYQKSEHLRVRPGLMPTRAPPARLVNAKPSGLCFCAPQPTAPVSAGIPDIRQEMRWSGAASGTVMRAANRIQPHSWSEALCR